MQIVCVSDIHARNIKLPDGDILIIAGDLTFDCSDYDLTYFDRWLAEQEEKFKYIVFIPGNHDKQFQNKSPKMQEYLRTLCKNGNVFYLEDNSVVLDGLVFYGSPWTPNFCNMAFNFSDEAEAKAHWDKLPEKIDVLITHGPPRLGTLDTSREGKPAGDAMLLEAVLRIKPRLHVFGHMHRGYGQQTVDGIMFVNASVLDDNYLMMHEPIVIELSSPKALDSSSSDEQKGGI